MADANPLIITDVTQGLLLISGAGSPLDARLEMPPHEVAAFLDGLREAHVRFERVAFKTWRIFPCVAHPVPAPSRMVVGVRVACLGATVILIAGLLEYVLVFFWPSIEKVLAPVPFAGGIIGGVITTVLIAVASIMRRRIRASLLSYTGMAEGSEGD